MKHYLSPDENIDLEQLDELLSGEGFLALEFGKSVEGLLHKRVAEPRGFDVLHCDH